MKILAAVAAIIFFAVGAMAETTNDLSDAEIQGQRLVQQLLEQTPATNSAQNGILKIHDAKGKTIEVPFQFKIVVTPNNWSSIYEATQFLGSVTGTNTGYTSSWTRDWYFQVTHSQNQPNEYFELGQPTKYLQNEFIDSDFCFADLGLEFFHWPEQKILKKENRRSRGCNVLESTNPNPSTNGYSRVISWIDEETLGIVEARAYDAQGKLLKEFYPKDFKKVDGQWQVGMMEMDNVQTKSRSRLEFDLKPK